MALSFAGTLDAAVVLESVGVIGALVRSAEVAAAWERESALPGMTVGGLTRHLVSQPETAVEFLRIPLPDGVPTLTLLAYADELDWLDAPVEAEENTSIRDDFNDMARAGHLESVAVLDSALEQLPAAIAAAGPLTFVPWQERALETDDFLVMRLLEIVVHSDDLASSVGLPTPAFPSEAVEPVVQLLATMALRRHPQVDVVRALARAERSTAPVSAF